jgi:hypothetical protein
MNGQIITFPVSTDRILAAWLVSAQQRLDQALQSGNPDSYRAAYAALEELKDCVRDVRAAERISA